MFCQRTAPQAHPTARRSRFPKMRQVRRARVPPRTNFAQATRVAGLRGDLGGELRYTQPGSSVPRARARQVPSRRRYYGLWCGSHSVWPLRHSAADEPLRLARRGILGHHRARVGRAPPWVYGGFLERASPSESTRRSAPVFVNFHRSKPRSIFSSPVALANLLCFPPRRGQSPEHAALSRSANGPAVAEIRHLQEMGPKGPFSGGRQWS